MAKTPVSILQEYCARNSVVPQYDLIVNGVGTHDPFFRYRLTVCDVVTYGDGKSKKEAKHEAARQAISDLLPNNVEIKTEICDANNADVTSPYEGAVKVNSVGELASICDTMNLSEPVYELVGEVGLPHAKTFTFECHVAKLKETASSRTKQQAKHLAAIKMINLLKLVVGPITVNKEEEEMKLKEANENAEDAFTKLLNKVTRFYDYFEARDSMLVADWFECSPLVNDLFSYNNSQVNGSAKIDPCEFLEKLCESGNKEVLFTRLSTKVTDSGNRIVYACHIDFIPDIVTLGLGSTDIEAKYNAAHHALLQLQSLSKA